MADDREAVADAAAVRDECVREVADYIVEIMGPTRHARTHAVAIVDMVILRAATLRP